ncbi:galactose-3-O-sulfotransferase 2-like [Liolophura sinensis]|uniref:galactose-3-O-sulfotransferase 2-like n=1 Tax=Liolophura sinensis TaxID=3198878 RepID=UPI0031588111
MLTVHHIKDLFCFPRRWIKLEHYFCTIIFLGTFGTILLVTRVTLSSTRQVDLCGKPKTHVFFLRVPKTGTSTSTFIFWRYAIRHNVSVLLPKPDKEETYSGIEPNLHEVNSPPYEIVANQLIYNPVNFARFLPNDTAYIAQLRHPLKHLSSVIHYHGHDYLQRLSQSDKVKEYLLNPMKYESKWNFGISLTNNPYAFYFGLDKRSLHNPVSIAAVLARAEKDFTAVLILERMDESLIMMKRTLCWRFEDIIYTVENVNRAKPQILLDKSVQEKHEKWAVADYKIYNHFVKKLQNYIENGGKDFQLEVSEFKSVLKDIHTFCDSSGREAGSYINLPGGAFYDPFTYTSENCTLLFTSAIDLRNIIRKRQGMKLE